MDLLFVTRNECKWILPVLWNNFRRAESWNGKITARNICRKSVPGSWEREARANNQAFVKSIKSIVIPPKIAVRKNNLGLHALLCFWISSPEALLLFASRMKVKKVSLTKRRTRKGGKHFCACWSSTLFFSNFSAVWTRGLKGTTSTCSKQTIHVPNHNQLAVNKPGFYDLFRWLISKRSDVYPQGKLFMCLIPIDPDTQDCKHPIELTAWRWFVFLHECWTFAPWNGMVMKATRCLECCWHQCPDQNMNWSDFSLHKLVDDLAAFLIAVHIHGAYFCISVSDREACVQGTFPVCWLFGTTAKLNCGEHFVKVFHRRPEWLTDQNKLVASLLLGLNWHLLLTAERFGLHVPWQWLQGKLKSCLTKNKKRNRLQHPVKFEEKSVRCESGILSSQFVLSRILLVELTGDLGFDGKHLG